VESRCYTADDQEVAAVTMEAFDDAIDVELDVLGFDAYPLPSPAVLQPATPPARRSATRGRYACGPGTRTRAHGNDPERRADIGFDKARLRK
jgi:hypothetical protein